MYYIYYIRLNAGRLHTFALRPALTMSNLLLFGLPRSSLLPTSPSSLPHTVTYTIPPFFSSHAHTTQTSLPVILISKLLPLPLSLSLFNLSSYQALVASSPRFIAPLTFLRHQTSLPVLISSYLLPTPQPRTTVVVLPADSRPRATHFPY